jgi:hypothetical protein
MNATLLCSLLLLLAGCAPSAERQTPRPADTTHRALPPPPPGGQAAPAAIKENMSLIGAALLAITLVDNYRYTLTLELRTVLPSGNDASLAESGQTVVVHPDYVTSDRGGISLENKRNQRLYELRTRKAGDAVMGTISLRDDGLWYIVDTEFR